MRSWGNRPDTFVCDEPLYAHFLQATGRVHPGAEEIVAYHEANWRRVVAWLTGPLPDGKTIFYQKHMAHHLLPEIDRRWLFDLTNCFLIREPREMLTSLVEIIPDAELPDTGLPQQVEIFNLITERTGRTPPVIDTRDVLEDPRAMLGLLCDAVGVAFTESMLSWPAGRRETDGVWAKHWYSSVEQSTTFAPYRPKLAKLPERLAPLLELCQDYYNQLYTHRLRV